MRLRVLGMILVLMLGFSVFSAYAQTEPGYFSQMKKTFTRGFKNGLSAPWEIPYTIKKYEQKNDGGNRFFQDAAGSVDGFLRMVTRYTCAAWDMVFSIVPGQQDGMPLKPETFF